MKITKSQLEQIIKEEVAILSEKENLDEWNWLKNLFRGGGRKSRTGGDTSGDKSKAGRVKSQARTETQATKNLKKQIRTELEKAKPEDPDTLNKAMDNVVSILIKAGADRSSLRVLIRSYARSFKKLMDNKPPTKSTKPEEGPPPSAGLPDEVLPAEDQEDKKARSQRAGDQGAQNRRALEAPPIDMNEAKESAIDFLAKLKPNKIKQDFKGAFNILRVAILGHINSTIIPLIPPAAGDKEEPGTEGEPEAGEPTPSAGEPSGGGGEAAAGEPAAAEEPTRKRPPGFNKPGKGRIAISHAVDNAIGADFKGDRNKIIKLVRDRFKRYANKQLGGLGNLVLTEQQMDDFARGFFRELRKMSALGNQLTNSQLGSIAQNLASQVKNNPEKGLAKGSKSGDKGGPTPGVVTDEEADAIVDKTAKNSKGLGGGGERSELVYNLVRKAGENAVEKLKNTKKFADASPEDIVDRQSSATKAQGGLSKGRKGFDREKFAQKVNKAGKQGLEKLRRDGKLDEAFVDRGERLYEALMKKFIK